MNALTKLPFLVMFSCAAGLLAAAPAGVPAKFTGPDATVRTAVEQAVLETNARMMAAANRLDADAFFDFILEAGEGQIVQNGVLCKTRAEALAAVKRSFQAVAKMDRRLDHPQVTVISPDCALLASEGSLTAVLADGRTVNSRFALSLVFVRQAGQWKLLHGHYSVPVAAGT